MGLMRLTAVAAALLSSTACITTGGQNITAFTSEPEGATVIVAGVGECETPCTVGHENVIDVTVAKAGFKKQEFRVEPGARTVKIILELAAPSGDVDEETLPEL